MRPGEHEAYLCVLPSSRVANDIGWCRALRSSCRRRWANTWACPGAAGAAGAAMWAWSGRARAR
eukprot:15461148-Alexandrium_andersonii.AAC.1